MASRAVDIRAHVRAERGVARAARGVGIRQCRGRGRHALRSCGRHRTRSQAHTSDRSLQGRVAAVRRRLDVGTRRGDIAAAHKPQSLDTLRHSTARNGRAAHTAHHRQYYRRRHTLHAMQRNERPWHGTGADTRYGRSVVVGLRLRIVGIYRRRFRSGHTQHARSRDIRAAHSLRAQIHEVQRGTRHDSSGRGAQHIVIRAVRRVVRTAARQRRGAPARQPSCRRLHP